MASSSVQIVCRDCQRLLPHQAKGYCMACYARWYRRQRDLARQEAVRTEAAHGPAADYECHRCKEDAVAWANRRAWCRDCIDLRLEEVRWAEKQLEMALVMIDEQVPERV